ncbi:hypothetical protein PF003_g22166 [Phytophthora fragariae]|nr:hypothetical protein PF003_g22166 [Phytophthora fragariae]
MISSRSTKLEPHPAIIARVYDIQFGARGLSIMPFWRFDFATRRAWYANGSVNLSNFSASVAMPKARKPQSLDDISNALTVLHVFAEEFFDQHTCWLVSSAREFVEELRSFCKWTPQDVGTLTFWFDRLFEDYRTATESDARHNVATGGVHHQFSSPRDPDDEPARTHTSARSYDKALVRSLAEGQASGTYLVINLPAALSWSELRFSPFGCVPKKNTDLQEEARLIHDLSYPGEMSTNASSTPTDLPDLAFESVRRIAQRIEDLTRRYPLRPVKMLKGDVKTAFRLIPVAPSLAAHFAGSCGDLAIIDMALPFGWTGSPAHYGAFGGAISFLVARESPSSLDPSECDDEPFFSFVWVDDHILLEDIPTKFRKIYKQRLPSSSGAHSPIHLASVTSLRGDNGTTSAPDAASTAGSSSTTLPSNLYNLLCSQLSAGKNAAILRINELTPYGLNSATFDCVINFTSDFDQRCNRTTNSSSKACAGSAPPVENVPLSPSQCFDGSPIQPTCDVIVRDSNGATSSSFTRATSVQITLRGSKTDQAGHSTKRTLLKSGLAPVCPVFAALLLQRNACLLKLSPDSPLCSIGRQRMLSADTMTKVLRLAAKQAGEDAERISTHSLRTGGASALHAAGVDADAIRMHGRWASDAYQAFLREASATSLQLAKRMGHVTSKPN